SPASRCSWRWPERAPTYGPTGAHVVILGSGFTGATSVALGTKSASFSVTSSTRIAATVPAASPGYYHWSVTTPGGTATSTAYYHHL
ncbi:MAG TPA: IPT/TIG domain-containing protein, partial [Gaiellaceae bacterium]|nr:IPT/TIG domain-containing protein [Gaiellaceae bacterium]